MPLVRRLALGVYLPLTLGYIGLALQGAVPIDILLRDAHAAGPRGSTPVPALFYRGALSNLGVLLWWAAAVLSAFSWRLLRAAHGGASVKGSRAFFGYLAVFSGLLALDDLFMLHEEVLPRYLGISELAVYICYGALALGFVRFAPLIFRTNFLLFGLALGFFAFSVLTDYGMLRFLFELPGRADLVIEDLSKLLGIVSWLGYTVDTAHKQVTRHLQAPLEKPATVLKQVRPPRTMVRPLKPLEKLS